MGDLSVPHTGTYFYSLVDLFSLHPTCVCMSCFLLIVSALFPDSVSSLTYSLFRSTI